MGILRDQAGGSRDDKKLAEMSTPIKKQRKKHCTTKGTLSAVAGRNAVLWFNNTGASLMDTCHRGMMIRLGGNMQIKLRYGDNGKVNKRQSVVYYILPILAWAVKSNEEQMRMCVNNPLPPSPLTAF